MNELERRNGSIRLAAEADLEDVRRLVNEAFAVERFLKKGGGDRLPEADGELDELFARGCFLVMEEDRGLTACVYVAPEGERCYLGLLSIAKGRQGQGLGRTMNAAAEDYARSCGCRVMYLRVVSPRREQLVPLYLRLGYAETGRQEYPEALIEKMALPGYFILMSKPL